MIEMTDDEKIATLQLAIRCSLRGLTSIDDRIVPTLERNWDKFDDGFKAFIKREVKRAYDSMEADDDYPIYTSADHRTITNHWIKFLTMG